MKKKRWIEKLLEDDHPLIKESEFYQIFSIFCYYYTFFREKLLNQIGIKFESSTLN